MKKIIILLISFFLAASIAALASPHRTESLGPLRPMMNAWGTTADGEYFGETTYEADYKIKLPNGKALFLTFFAREVSGGEQKREHSFSIREEKNFSGKFNLCLLNRGKQTIKQYYKGELKGEFFVYNKFNFKAAKKDAAFALELLMKDGSVIYVTIDEKMAKEWIFIADLFPD